jgi:hypothetical protein
MSSGNNNSDTTGKQTPEEGKIVKRESFWDKYKWVILLILLILLLFWLYTANKSKDASEPSRVIGPIMGKNDLNVASPPTIVCSVYPAQ